MNPSPETTLQNVRHAYRLLHDYQRLILDSIGFIGNQLGFQYFGGWQQFASPAPRNGKGNLNEWAWDWLGLYYYQFHFTCEDQQLSAFHIPDTAALMVDIRERPNTEKFTSADSSKSMVAFIYAPNSEDWSINHINADPKLLVQAAETNRNIAPGVQARFFKIERIFTENSAREVVDDLRASFGLDGLNPQV